MKGLIKKDILILKNNWKSLILLLVIYCLCGIENDGVESFIVPFMMAMLCMSTFNYDEFNKWDAYAITLPGGRESIVKAKYVAAIIFLLFGVVISLAFSLILGIAKGGWDLNTNLEMILGGLASGFLVVSIMFPLIMKFGLEKGRLIIVGLSFGFATAITIIAQSGVLNGALRFLNDYPFAAFPMITTILFAGSYIMSKKIYLKKEF